MHTDIKYGNTNEHENKLNALKDIRNWLGDKYEDSEALFRAHQATSQQYFEACCSVQGIEGYPVKVYYEHIYNRKWNEKI